MLGPLHSPGTEVEFPLLGSSLLGSIPVHSSLCDSTLVCSPLTKCPQAQREPVWEEDSSSGALPKPT